MIDQLLLNGRRTLMTLLKRCFTLTALVVTQASLSFASGPALGEIEVLDTFRDADQQTFATVFQWKDSPVDSIYLNGFDLILPLVSEQDRLVFDSGRETVQACDRAVCLEATIRGEIITSTTKSGKTVQRMEYELNTIDAKGVATGRRQHKPLTAETQSQGLAVGRRQHKPLTSDLATGRRQHGPSYPYPTATTTSTNTADLATGRRNHKP
jgi:hypothetical protein